MRKKADNLTNNYNSDGLFTGQDNAPLPLNYQVGPVDRYTRGGQFNGQDNAPLSSRPVEKPTPMAIPQTNTPDYTMWQANKDKEYNNSIWRKFPQFMQPASAAPQTKRDYYTAMQEMTRKQNSNKQNEGSFYQDTGWDALHPATIQRIQNQVAADKASLEAAAPAREARQRYEDALTVNEMRAKRGAAPLPVPPAQPIEPPVRPTGPTTPEQRQQYYTAMDNYDDQQHQQWLAQQSPEVQAAVAGQVSPFEKQRMAYNERINNTIKAPSAPKIGMTNEPVPGTAVGDTVSPTGTFTPRTATYGSDGTVQPRGTLNGQAAKDYYAQRKAQTGQLTPKEQLAKEKGAPIPIQQRFANMQDTLNKAKPEARARMLNALENGIYSGLTPEEKKAVNSVRIAGNRRSYRNAAALAKRYKSGETNTDYASMRVKHRNDNKRQVAGPTKDMSKESAAQESNMNRYSMSYVMGWKAGYMSKEAVIAAPAQSPNMQPNPEQSPNMQPGQGMQTVPQPIFQPDPAVQQQQQQARELEAKQQQIAEIDAQNKQLEADRKLQAAKLKNQDLMQQQANENAQSQALNAALPPREK